MPSPISAKKKLVVFKIESSEGVDPTPTGALNSILTSGFKLTPMDGDDVQRDLDRPYLANDEMFPTGLRAKLSFKVELAPSGVAGTASGWGPLLRACGISETIVASTSVTYAPITDNMESGTFYIWHGLTKQVIVGARGTVTMRFTAQQIPYLEFEFTGLYADPAEAAQLVPTYTGFKKPLIVNKANTTYLLNSVALLLKEFSLNVNNQVEPRLLVASERIIVPDRREQVAIRVEAVPISTFNPFSLAKAQTQMASSLVHGTVAGAIATLSCPTMALKRPSYDEAQNIMEWPLEGVPLPASGNDQWSLALT